MSKCTVRLLPYRPYLLIHSPSDILCAAASAQLPAMAVDADSDRWPAFMRCNDDYEVHHRARVILMFARLSDEQHNKRTLMVAGAVRRTVQRRSGWQYKC